MAELATRFTRRVWAAPKGGDLGEITEGMPALDEVRMKQIMRASDSVLIGPNGPGVISPGAKAKVEALVERTR